MKVNPDQFKLFMTGTEWQAHVTHSTDGPLDKVWSEKESRARAPFQGSSGHWGPNQVDGGLYDSMRTHGYQSSPGYDPIALEHTTPTIILEDSPNGKDVRRVQSQGHHRVAAAAAVERDTGKPVYIPTNYVDNTSGARARHREQVMKRHGGRL